MSKGPLFLNWYISVIKLVANILHPKHGWFYSHLVKVFIHLIGDLSYEAYL